MWKGLRRFFKRSDEKFTNVNLEDANIFKRILFIVLSNIKTIVVLMCVFVFISLIVTTKQTGSTQMTVTKTNHTLTQTLRLMFQTYQKHHSD